MSFYEGELSDDAMELIRQMLEISQDRPVGSMVIVTLRQLAHRMALTKSKMSAVDGAAFLLAGSYVVEQALRELGAEAQTDALISKLKGKQS